MHHSIQRSDPANWRTRTHNLVVVPVAGILLSGMLAACAIPPAQPASDSTIATSAATAPATTASDSVTSSETPSTTGDEAVEAAGVAKLNLNTATEEEFLTVPNVGDRMVREFFEYRPYVSIQQFRREIGKYVDEAQVAEYEQYVYVPVNPNEVDEETLQQLPGVDATVAAELVAGRPYADHAAFLAKLAEYVSPAELADAETYLETE